MKLILKQGIVIAAVALSMGGYQISMAQTLPQQNIDAIKRHAAVGDAAAQYNLGVMYLEGQGVEQDVVKAVEWYEKAVAQGLAEAQYNLGWMYATGKGVSQNYAKAIDLFEMAAAQGDAESQYNLGVILYIDKGNYQNKSISKKWFKKSCDGGNQTGCEKYQILEEEGY